LEYRGCCINSHGNVVLSFFIKIAFVAQFLLL
jgi:hypothetical protein